MEGGEGTTEGQSHVCTQHGTEFQSIRGSPLGECGGLSLDVPDKQASGAEGPQQLCVTTSSSGPGRAGPTVPEKQTKEYAQS